MPVRFPLRLQIIIMRTRYWFSRKQEQLSIKSDIFGLAKFLGSGIIVPHRHTTNLIDGEVYTEKTSGEDVHNWDDAVLVKETQDDRL